jgi:alkaline phosphatase
MMKKKSKTNEVGSSWFTPALVCLIAFLVGGCSSNGSDNGSDEPPAAKSIILFIGDGMGANHRQAAQWASVGPSQWLWMDTLDYHGWVRTGSANNEVTDSAAAATAMATGVKTNNGVIGMNADLIPVTSILEEAKQKGKKVGLVTNTQIAHATPAAFAAHVTQRSQMNAIASQMIEAGVDVLLGGGEDEFIPNTETGCYPQAGERDDGRDLIDEAITAGYQYVCDAEGLSRVDIVSAQKILGLFADEGLVRPHSPALDQMVQTAIAILSQSANGFFLLVEAGQIDWAASDQDAVNTIDDTLGLDDAVRVALDYVQLNAATLLIVVADHETGGMTLSLNPTGAIDEDGPFAMPTGGQFYVNWSAPGHTAWDVPITASGPFADRLQGEFENTHIYDVMHASIE